MLDLLLLASVGNFVASTPGERRSQQRAASSGAGGGSGSSIADRAMPSVVVDAYTGQLVMHAPYDAVRGYFVAGLLVISIIVISRLTFVRNNTYTTTVHLAAAKDR